MKNKYKDLLKNTALIAFGNFSSKILIFLLIPIYTRYLSTSEYGFYDLTYTTIQLLFPILTLGITESIMYFLLKDKIDTKDVFSTNIIFIIIAFILFNILLIINYIFGIFEQINNYIIYVSIFYLLYCLNNCFIQFAKGINKVKHMSIAGILGTASMLLFNILFLVVFKYGLDGYFLANILGLFIPVLYLFIALKLWNYFKICKDKKVVKKIILFSLPLIVNTLAWWVNNTADRYIITYFHGVDSNGLLSVAYKIPSILTAISAIFIQAWQISAIKEHNENSKKFYSDLFFIFSGILTLISGFLIICVKPIASLMFANDFYNAWNLVPFLLVSSLFNQTSGYIGAILIADDNSKGMAISAFIGIFCNIVFNIIFTILLGPLGITIATMISSFVIYFMRERFSKGVIISNKFKYIMLSWITIVIISILTIYTDNIIFVIISIILYLLTIFIYKDIFKYCLDFILKRRKKND